MGLPPWMIRAKRSPSSAPFEGTFSLEGRRLGRLIAAPTADIETVSSFVGAGHWPARRCTRRVQEAAPYSPAPAVTYSAKSGAEVEPHPL